MNVSFLNQNRIETRNIFAGNMVRQPAFAALAPGAFRIAGTLDNTDYVMNNTFFLGTCPGVTPAMLAVTADRFREFMAKH